MMTAVHCKCKDEAVMQNAVKDIVRMQNAVKDISRYLDKEHSRLQT